MPDRLRILVLNERDPEHPRAGGAEVHVREIALRLARFGIETTLASSSFPGAPPRSHLDGIEVVRHGPVPLYYPRVAWATRRETARGRYDLVVEHLNKLPFFAVLYAKRPVLAVCHHLLAETAFLQAPWPVATVVVGSERLIPLAYRRVPLVAVSESTRRDLVDRGLPAEQIHIVHNGIALPPRPPRPAGERPTVAVYLGRLEPYKRVEVFLEVLARLRRTGHPVEGIVVGRGTAEGSLRRRCAALGLAGHVRFTGFVPDDERDRILASARVCLAPSLREGWGITVIEANAHGVPVVASRAPGLRDAVRDGETGFLVDPDSTDAFATRTRELLLDEALANRMSRSARRWAERFSWDAAAQRMAELIRRAVDGPGPDPAPGP